MELPKFNETFLPILHTLSDGNIVHHRELIRLVQEKYYSDLLFRKWWWDIEKCIPMATL